MNATLLALIINGMRLCGSDYEAALERSNTEYKTYVNNPTILRNSIAADEAQYSECVGVVTNLINAYKLSKPGKVEALSTLSLLVIAEQSVARRMASAKSEIAAIIYYGDN